MKVLVINCGSSSIKYRLYEMPARDLVSKGLLERIGELDSLLTHHFSGKSIEIKGDIQDHESGLHLIIKTLTDEACGVISDISEISAVGHRVVHGGEVFPRTTLITDEVIKIIEEYVDLAPLHNPPNLQGIKAASRLFPGIPQVAAFDTAFHQTMPPKAYLYALPYDYYSKYRVRRYGFHGTSHRYIARKAARIMGKDKREVNFITCHLGNGCSVTAVEGGRSVDTSMGLTPLEGLVMGTRCGDIDPAVIFYLAEKQKMDLNRINKLFTEESGLLGISGVSNDMRLILEASEKGNERAKLALEIFCYRIKKYIGAYCAVLGRVDALIFAGGIGENAVRVRRKICRNLKNLGIELDENKNQSAVGEEKEISTESSLIKVFVIPTNEEARIAFDTYEIAQGIEEKEKLK